MEGAAGACLPPVSRTAGVHSTRILQFSARPAEDAGDGFPPDRVDPSKVMRQALTRRILGQASRNSTWLLLGQAAGVLLATAFAVPAARMLGAHEFGQYAYASTLTSFLTLAASLGIDVLLVRNLARDFTRRAEEFGGAIVIRTVAWALGMGGLAVFARASGADSGALLVFGASVLPVLLTGCATAVMAAREEMRFVSVLQTGTSALRVVLSLIALHSGEGVLGVAWANLAAASAGMVSAFLLVGRRYGLGLAPVDWHRLVAMARAAAPFGMAGLLFTIYFRFNTVLLGATGAGAEVGFYAVGSRIMEAYLLVPGSILAASFPILSRLHGTDGAAFSRTCRVLHRVVLAIAWPTVAILAARPGDLLAWIFGMDYAQAGRCLSVIAWMAPLLAVNLVLGNTLFATGRSGAVLRTEAAGVGVSVLAGLILVPRWGALGAAIAIVVTEVAVVSRNLWALRQDRSVFPGSDAFVPAVPAAFLAYLIAAHTPLPLIASVLLGGGAYVALFVLGGGLDATERARFRALTAMPKAGRS